MKNRIKYLYNQYKEMILYIVFGVLTTAINYGSYFLLAHPMGLSVIASNVIAWIVAVLFAFVTNKLLVFDSKSLRFDLVLKELVSFAACRFFSGALDTGIMLVFVNMLHFSDLIIKLLSNVLVIIINYILSKFFIFAQKGKIVNG